MLKEFINNRVFRLLILFWIFFVFNSKYLEKLLVEWGEDFVEILEFKFIFCLVEKDDLKNELVKLKGYL